MQENNMYPTSPATTPSEGVDQIISDNIINPVSPKKFPFVFVLLVILLSVASIISVYLFIQVRTHSLSNSNPSPTPSPVASADPTAGWQSYSNEDYSFSFRYPNEWEEYKLDNGGIFQISIDLSDSQFGLIDCDQSNDCIATASIELDVKKLENEFSPAISPCSMFGECLLAGKVDSLDGKDVKTTMEYLRKDSIYPIYSYIFINDKYVVRAKSYLPSSKNCIGQEDGGDCGLTEDNENIKKVGEQIVQILSTFKFITNEAKSKVQKSSFSGSLQDYLQKNCKPGNPYSIDINQLPVKLNSKYVIPMERPDGIFATCRTTDPDQLTESFVSINSTNNQAIYIYDKFSNELGHGGKPFLGFGGVEIYNQNSERIGAYFNDGEGPALLGQSSIHLRGVKEFVSQSGETFYINIDSVALPGDNPRLVEYLKPYSVDEGFSLPSVDTSKIDNSSLIKYFFATPKEGSPEYNSLTQMKQILSDISAK